MNNFDDIFERPQEHGGQQNKPFDKDAWAGRKQAERQSIYDLADQ